MRTRGRLALRRLQRPMSAAEDGADESAEIVFCLDDLETGAQDPCTVHIPLAETTEHKFEFGTKVGGVPQEIPGEGIEGFRCEIVGHWKTEQTPNAAAGEIDPEVTHL
jgi:hypothetical protein